MNDLNGLEHEIRQRLDAAAARRHDNQNRVQQEMEELQRHKESFDVFARRVTDVVIRPRMMKLAGFFENSELADLDAAVGYGCVCQFHHTTEYPANTTLTICVSADRAAGNALVTYDLEIIPIFFRFKGHDQLVVPMASIDEKTVEDWIERKLVEFTDAYLQLQVVEQYQQSNVVIDPVCGMQINQADAAAHLDYGGRKYYFCVDQCRERFLSAPDRYAVKRQN
jgi:YHS domain-containing protein